MKALSKIEGPEAVSSLPVSISDVAKRARVSISTVSRVLNRRELVSERTRARVESAIETLGYRPNAFARGLMLGRSEIVGLVLPDLHGEFYSEIIRGANSRAREMGYNLVVSSTRDGDDSHSLVRAIQQRSLLDGVAIMVSEVTDRVRDALRELRVPFVVLDDEIDGAPHDSVIIDQRHGARAVVEHMVTRCGARRIVFLGGLATNLDTLARLDACREALTEAGLGLDAADVHYLDYQFETAYHFALERVAQWAAPGVCVFAANDEMASGVVAAATARGVAVPGQLSVVGFDDTRVARMTRPALTTVRVPMFEMGSRAIELLCQRVVEPNRPNERVTLRPELILRESSGVAMSR